MWLLGYSGWFQGCCFVVARVPGAVARVLLPLSNSSGLKDQGNHCMCFQIRR